MSFTQVLTAEVAVRAQTQTRLLLSQQAVLAAADKLLQHLLPTRTLNDVVSVLSSTLCLGVCVSARYERLEDQLNDLTELHQNETSNLKQELASIEEKVAYQAYERARDIQVITE